jgi:dolichol-phosphate mannosyltransferase
MKISVIIPLYNESENIIDLHKDLTAVFKNLIAEYEIIYVDDASNDATLKEMQKIKSQDINVRCLSLQKRSGQSTALYIGFSKAKYPNFLLLDGDRQNDIASIPMMLETYAREGYDLLNGIRKTRQDNLTKKISSRIANNIRRWLLDDPIVDTCCAQKIIRQEYALRIRPFIGFHRFLPFLVRIEGGKVGEVIVNHFPRNFGKSKYGTFQRLVESVPDLLAAYWMKKKYIVPKIQGNYLKEFN